MKNISKHDLTDSYYKYAIFICRSYILPFWIYPVACIYPVASMFSQKAKCNRDDLGVFTNNRFSFL